MKSVVRNSNMACRSQYIFSGLIVALCLSWGNTSTAQEVWWSGLGDGQYWADPCNWLTETVPTASQSVGMNPGDVNDPCTIIISPLTDAECSWINMGGGTSYVNLAVHGTLDIGGLLRVVSWTGFSKGELVINGGTVDVGGDSDSSYITVNSGQLTVGGQLGMGVSTWSDQHLLRINDGTVTAGSFVMQDNGYNSANLNTDIEAGRLIVDGDQASLVGGYVGSGLITAYGGDPNYQIVIARDDINDTTIITTGLVSAQKATIVEPNNGSYVPWEDPCNPGYGPTVSWLPGDGATAHRVYFGKSYSSVGDANESSGEYKGEQVFGQMSYTVLLADVALDQTYYWRIDEVVGGIPVKGDIWSFTVLDHRVLDDFETYWFDSDLWAVWEDGYTNGTGSSIYLEVVNQYQGWVGMQLVYNNTSSPFVSEAGLPLDGSPGKPNDWTAADVKLLTVSLHGNPGFSEKVYVMLQSNNGAQSGIVYYPNPDELRQQAHEWYRWWAIDLGEFASQGVDLANVTRMLIGVGDKNSPAAGTSGTLLVDNVYLQPAMCVARDNDADINNDCVVDADDLAALTNDWLARGYVVTASAPAVGPVLWYKCDEGTGFDLLDSSGNAQTAYLNRSSWAGPGSGYDGSNCVNLNNNTYAEVPLAAVDANWGAECTFSLWLKDPGQSDNDSTLFQISVSGDGDPQVWSGSTGFMSWQCGYSSDTGWADVLWYGQHYNYSNPDHPLNEWVHYAYVKSYSAGYLRIYQNGALVAESDASGDSLNEPVEGSDFFSIGAWRWSGGSGGFYDGLLDDFRVYDYALSQAEVLSLAAAGGAATSPYTQSLLTPSDILADDIVDFADYAVMGAKWLEDVVYP